MPSRRRNAPVDVDAEEALVLATAQSENVFLFIPNLIGYTRILLAGLSLHYMSYHPIYSTAAYCVSCLLDAFDGWAARKWHQESKFGAVLDMVTDRCTTSCLLCYLSSAYPDYALTFQFLIALDFSSHYMHMYSSLVTGSSSHKDVHNDVSRILRWYYTDKITLFVVCAANELFFVSLYLMKWTSKPVDLLEDIPWASGLTYAQLFALCTFPWLTDYIPSLDAFAGSFSPLKVSVEDSPSLVFSVYTSLCLAPRKESTCKTCGIHETPLFFDCCTSREEPPDAPPANSASPPEPPEEPEPEKIKRRVKAKEPVRDVPLELPEGLALEILWQPEFDPEPSNRDALPPPEIFDEALHNLHITLHPQTQHQATYLPPLGALVEPTLALYCPIEGGDYVIDATVRELARRTNAEVLVLDAAQLAAGEWGAFGKAANSLQLPRNPLHFRAPQPSNSRPSSHEEEEEDFEQPSMPFSPPQMTLTVLNPTMTSGRVVSARRSGPPSKIEVFFETLVNTPSPDESEQTPRPRLIYIRDFPTLAPSSSAWYPPLVASVRARRRKAMARSTSTIIHPVTIVFGISPPLVPKVHTGPPARAPTPYNRPRTVRVTTSSRHNDAEWGEDAAGDRARERRLRERLRRWEKGDGLQDQIPKLSLTEGEGGGDSLPAFLIMLAQNGGSSDSGNRDSGSESDSPFFRTSVLVPTTRSLPEERACRVARRREINELTMRMAVGAIGGVIDKRAAVSLEVEAQAGPSSQPISPKRGMWEDWGNRIEVWSEVRAVADRAVGHAVASRASTDTSSPVLSPTLIEWPAIDNARTAYRASRNLRRAWTKGASGTSTSAREQEEDEDEDEGDESESEEVDEVLERLKNEEELNPYEQRLLGCIVNSATMPTSFSQVHLPPHTIDSIRTIVSLPLIHPQAFQQGILKEHGMTGCLLFGPPGTGKTLVVRALAKEAGCRMMAISPSDVMDMYVGEGEKLVKAVFTLARKIAPCVVFLDEIDALFSARVSSRDRAPFSHRGVLTEFMQEMDGLRSSKDDNVIVIGATNRPFDLDDAVLRRLPRRLLVDLPGERERQEILKILLRDETLGPDVDIEDIGKKTENFSGSDLKHLCVSAALDAVKEHVVVPWSSTSTPQSTSDHALVSDAAILQPTELTESASTSVDSESPTSSNSTGDVVPPPTVVPRILHLRHFTKALKEISPSSSESLGTLADLKKWNEEFGEGKGQKKRQQVWGKGLFGFTERVNTKETGRVAPADSEQR
ncbi:AAA domain-containing protein [Mycena sanguinolenta]|uniref:CDP-diacylglycerol--inositol 3-phosphatidyltransferase n=1 Tax=Mycena sanguinolenta TaxID=230812 RepID=A0A8H7D6P5_9AGAR|nr:AAA domain-containing protein [Mycena sanguinolenta]